MRGAGRWLLALALAISGCSGAISKTDGRSALDAQVLEDGSDGLSPAARPTSTAPGYELIGKVVDARGVPVPDAEVTVGGVSTITAPDGWFDLTTSSVGTIDVVKPAWEAGQAVWDGSGSFVTITLEPKKIRGLRVSGPAAGDDAAFAEILDLADQTAVNALVFDTKQEGGTVLYDTAVTDAHDSGAVINSYDPVQRIGQAREHGLYLITRIVSFEDTLRARSHPEEVLAGRWLNPLDRSAWEYPLALAAEACELGFNEIQFDYVRWPSGEAVKTSGQLEMSQAARIAAIEGFLREARTRIHPLGCAVSADVFGVVVAAGNDQGIGQRPEELTRQLDAFSPMIYPSHYSPGWIGFDDPNDHPYDVTARAIDDALPRLDPGTILRPWLQAFWWTNEEIRRSIQAAEDRDVGWILWNAVSNFSRSALPTDAEVSD